MKYETRGFIDELVEKRARHKDLVIRYEIEKSNLIVCMFSIDDREYSRREIVLKSLEDEIERFENYFESVYNAYNDSLVF